MALGKKKNKKNQQEAQASIKVDMSQNPLYPKKSESEVKGVLVALGTFAACVIVSGVIISNFSYAVKGSPYDTNSRNNMAYDDQSDSYMSDSYDENTDQGDVYTGDSYDENSDDDASAANDFVEGTIDSAGEDEESEQETETEENGDFIFADSDMRVLSESDLTELSETELSYARNEIYARHGRKFQDPTLQEYFDEKEWYEGTIEPEDFTQEMLNQIEIDNTNLILEYEKAQGYR